MPFNAVPIQGRQDPRRNVLDVVGFESDINDCGWWRFSSQEDQLTEIRVAGNENAILKCCQRENLLITRIVAYAVNRANYVVASLG